MKVLAVLLVIISLSKLMISISSNHSDNPIINCSEMNQMFDPEWLQNVCCAILTGDGLIGLFCGLFILFT